jgi:deazaflavin-dependent oxidoreductase (nitroreductase family)
MVKRLPDRAYRVIGFVGTSRPVTRLHPHVYRFTGGRGPIGRNFGVQNVIVTMTGRTTGKRREVPLFAFADGADFIVIGSNGGDDREPAWVGNLRAEPAATLRVGRRQWPVRAHVAEAEERERLWGLAATAYPGYEVYRAMTDRRIPVVVLRPAEADSDSAAPVAPASARPDLGDPPSSPADPQEA